MEQETFFQSLMGYHLVRNNGQIADTSFKTTLFQIFIMLVPTSTSTRTVSDCNLIF